jgi:hypothetical protein
MKSCESLPPLPLAEAGEITAAFVSAGLTDYRSAARYVRSLAYGRNHDRADYLSVMREGRGTCSGKHALLARLAIEQRLPISLMIGIYEMSKRNTPGVGAVLRRSRLAAIPEAHCYLMYQGERIDVTRAVATEESITAFLREEMIVPDQVGAYKTAIHRAYIREWLAHKPALSSVNLDEIWKIREECIATMSE